MKKVLFIVPHRLGRSPGQRFRFEQYLNLLQDNGFIIEVSYFINEKDDHVFYSRGNYFKKLKILLDRKSTRLNSSH